MYSFSNVIQIVFYLSMIVFLSTAVYVLARHLLNKLIVIALIATALTGYFYLAGTVGYSKYLFQASTGLLILVLSLKLLDMVNRSRNRPSL